MKKYSIGLFACVVIIGSLFAQSGVVRAQVVGGAVAIQAQIQQLLQQVQQLQAQLRTMQGSTGSSQPVSISSGIQESIAAGCAIDLGLFYGSRGNSVSLLQNVLHAEGSYPEGIVTGFYGSLTTAAVKRFQQNHGISATGSIDAKTADTINALVPQYYSCGSVGFQQVTGILQSAQISTAMWGSFTLTVGSGGDVADNVQGPVLVYRVLGGNDTVMSLLKQYVGQRVTVAGDIKYYSLEGGFWGIVAQSVYPAGTITPASGPIVVVSPQAGATWTVGNTYTIQWAMNQKDVLKPQGTVTITTGRPVPACLRSTPPCMLAMPSIIPYTIVSSAANTGSYTWTIPAALPALNIGSQEITVTLDGADTQGVSGTFSIVQGQANQMLNIITTTLPVGTVGQPYTTTIQARGGTGEYAWSVTGGSLPGGIMQSKDGIVCAVAPCPQSLVLGGTPTQAGTYTFVVRVTSGTQTATQTFSLSILSVSSAGLTIKTADLPSGIMGQAYNATVLASGGSDSYGWSVIEGSLPDGLTLTSPVCIKFPCQVGGLISGTPTRVGTYTAGIQVVSGSMTAEKKFPIVITVHSIY
ncbi:MAG: peptidoglycan-binding protein [Candidatus Paceibacterota bacterium]|jgi:peptidoglycan hydrolase-like protein with peptidoglycan-binding domain